MNSTDLVQYFTQTLQSDPNMSEAVAAIQTLLEYIKLDNSVSTMSELRQEINKRIDELIKCKHNALVAPILSGCQLFLRFITYTASLHATDFQDCKKALVDRGHLFLKKISASRQKIATLAHPFIPDGSTILVHSRSRVVLEVLQEALKNRKRFNVYVTETSQNGSGHQMHRDLENLGIPSTIILDTAIGYIMEKVDMVWVGAEGVVESGGIINRAGTFTAAICAKEMNKPFYVVAESLKFSRLYPLNQEDIPQEFKYSSAVLESNGDFSKEHPMVDYTPPAYITLLFTDLGILTPSAVSDELIKLYL